MKRTKTKLQQQLCLICNAEAHIVNYGALSCYSCKTFFRRHSFRIKNIRPCRYENHCEITMETRKLCASCRIKKCLAMGMTPELIRKEYKRKKSHLNVQLTHNEPIQKLPITSLNLLHNDQSSLSQYEWNLLSNVIHAFDQFSLVSTMIHMIESINSHSSDIKIDVLDTFNLFASFYTSAKSFISSTADFRVLTTAEQSSLYQRNLHGLFNFCGTFMLRDAGMFGSKRNERILVPLYGHDIVHEAKKITSRLDIDSTLVKVIHIIFAFSTNSYTINYDTYMNNDALLLGAFRLLGSQNVYVEILWKYMLYRYGYHESIFRFAGLVKHMLDLIILSAGIYTENPHHQILVDDLVEEAKISLILDEKNDSIPLWGKT